METIHLRPIEELKKQCNELMKTKFVYSYISNQKQASSFGS